MSNKKNKVAKDIEKDSIKEVDGSKVEESAKVEKVKSSSSEKKSKCLDKFHKEHNAQSFTSPINPFKFYLLDQSGVAHTPKEVVKRGIIMVDSFQQWEDLIKKNEKLLFNFKCVKGADLRHRYKKLYNKLSILAFEQ